jgi:hypothetical protein
VRSDRPSFVRRPPSNPLTTAALDKGLEDRS